MEIEKDVEWGTSSTVQIADDVDDDTDEGSFFDTWQVQPCDSDEAPLNDVYTSPVHLEMCQPTTADSSSSGSTIRLPTGVLRCRTILPKDRTRIQQLHEEWFPVTYQPEFYDDLVHGKMCHTGDELYTNVAVNDQDEVVACLVAMMVNANRLNGTSRKLLLPDYSHHGRHCRLCYIMTLGTVTEYRQAGLASALVERCIQQLIDTDPQCGALYLHVITLNPAAIRFYERLGFWRVQEIPDYYTIDGKHYNCFLYAKYFHGNRGHLDLFQILSWWVSSLWEILKQPLYYLFKYRLGFSRNNAAYQDSKSSTTASRPLT